MAQNVIAGSVLSGFIRTEFTRTYQRMITDVNARLRNVMQFGVPSSRLQETYAYFTAPAHPQRWVRGEDIHEQPFEDVTFNVVNYDWGQRIRWHRNDREDDQTASLLQQARSVGTGFALLRERIFFQILTNSTDAALLPAVPNAPDGASFFATTAGGSNRFGVSGGNIVTGSGVSTAQDVRNDVYNGIERFHQFQDGEGQPLWPEALLDRGYTLIYNVANDQLVKEALVQSRTLQHIAGSTIEGSAGTGENVGAAVTNIIMDAGMSLTLWPTQRISDNDMFLFANGSPIKAVFEQMRRPLTESVATAENSDQSRDTKEEYVQWDERFGVGLALPYQAIQINN